MKYQLLIKTGPEQTDGIVREAIDKADMLEQTEKILKPLSLGFPIFFEVNIPQDSGSASIVIFPQILDKITIAVVTVPDEPEPMAE